MVHVAEVAAASLASSLPLHGASPTSPVPGWLVLVGGFVALWVVVAGAVEAVDRLFDALEAP